MPSALLGRLLHPRRAVVLLAAVVAAMLAAIVAYDLRREYLGAVEAAGARTVNITRVLEEHTRQSLRRIELSTMRAADEFMRAGGLSRADPGALRERLRDLLPADGLIRNFSVADRDGVTVLSTLDVDVRSLPTMAERDYFVAHRERADVQIMIGGAVKSRATGTWTLPVAARLAAADGAFQGVLLASVEPARLQVFYNSINTGADGFVTLFHRSGWIIVRAPFEDKVLFRNWSDAPMFREHLPAAAVKTVRQVVVADGVERIYSYRALADYPVVVSLGLSLTDILAQWRARAWRDGILLLIALGALASATWALTRQLRRREAAEISLRGSSERLALTARAARVGLWDWDLRTDRVYFSPEWKSQLGYEEHEVSHDFVEWQQRLHPDDLERSLKIVRSYVANPWPDYELEFRLRHKNGAYRWILAQASLEYDAQGKPVRMLGSHVDITERKRAEEAFLEHKALLEAIVQGTSDAVYVKDTQGRYRLLNRAGLQMLGKDLVQVLGNDDRTLFGPEEGQRVMECDRQVMEADAALTFEETVGMAGAERTFLSTKGPLHDAQGRPSGLFGIARDITERKSAESALRESTRKLNAIIDNVSGFVYRCANTPEWRTDYISGGVFDLLGYRPEEFTSGRRTGASVIVPEDRERVWREIQAGVEAHRTYELEYRALHASGEERIVLEKGAGVFDGENLLALEGLVTDVTERRRAEDGMRESEERYRELVENVGDLICSHDLEGKILFANRASAELLGYTAEEIRGMNLGEVLDPEVRAQLGEYLAALARDGTANGLMRVRTRAGEARVWEYRNMLRVRGGAPVVHGVARDITERRRVEEERKALARRVITAQEEERRRIALELHDDIGQALTAVKLNLQVVRRARRVEARGRALEDGLAIADEAAERVRSMALELRPQVLDDLGLGPALDWYCARLSRRSRLRIETDIEPAAGAAKGPAAVACYRIAQEALTNALRHAGARELRVKLARRAGELLLEIADDGAGFDPRRVRSREAIGLLGMRERARDAAGTLSIESRPGEGTRVRARFPLKEA